MKKVLFLAFVICTVFNSVCLADYSNNDMWVSNTLDRIVPNSVEHINYNGFSVTKVKVIALDNNNLNMIYNDTFWIDTDNQTWLIQYNTHEQEINNKWIILNSTINDPRLQSNWRHYDANNSNDDITSILQTIDANRL